MKNRKNNRNEQNTGKNRKDRANRKSVSENKQLTKTDIDTEPDTNTNKNKEERQKRNNRTKPTQNSRNKPPGSRKYGGVSSAADKKKFPWQRPALAAAMIIWCAAWFYLVGANLYAEHLTDTGNSFEALEKAAELDRFEHADYELSYVLSTMDPEAEIPSKIKSKADEYAGKLMKVNSNTIPYYLAGYYFTNGDTEKGFDAALKYLSFMHSSPTAWQNTLDLLSSADDGSTEFRERMPEVIALLDRYHEESLEQIELDELARIFFESYR